MNTQAAARFEDQALVAALHIVSERVRALPREDRDDLLELSAAYLAADDAEERDSAARAMMEIFEQAPARVGSLQTPERSERLSSWSSAVSKRIRELRAKAGLTQGQLAQRAGLTQSHVSRLEAGTHTPNGLTLEKLEKALGVGIAPPVPSEAS